MFSEIRKELIEPGDIRTGQRTLFQMNKILGMIIEAGEALEKKASKKPKKD